MRFRVLSISLGEAMRLAANGNKTQKERKADEQLHTRARR